MSDVRVYLVSYDIADRRRWRRVFKLMKRMGEHAQLSVFLCRLRPARMVRLQARLGGLINPEEDRLMVVELGNVDAARGRLRATEVPALLEAPRPVIV
jgi:CRISPR-associated protein Cas2